MKDAKIIAAYIPASKKIGTLYTGSAIHLTDGVWPHLSRAHPRDDIDPEQRSSH